MLDAGDKSMVLWFGLGKRIEKVEEDIEDLADSISELNKAVQNLSELVKNQRLERQREEEYTNVPPAQAYDKLTEKVERMKFQILKRKIESLEKMVKVPVVEQAVEETTGLEPDVLQNILNFAKEHPEIVETIKNIFSSNKTPQQQKQEVENVLEQYLRPIPLKQSQGQTQQ